MWSMLSDSDIQRRLVRFSDAIRIPTNEYFLSKCEIKA